ncbi:MAG TPA: hypothetical protein V6D47_12440, partial [Oscillatoriaceae cyanobacterium]
DQLTNRHAVVRRRHGVSFLGLHNRKEPWRRLLFKVRRFLHHPTGRYQKLRGYLEKNPLAAWTNPGKAGRRVYFAYKDGTMRYVGPTCEDLHLFAAAARERVEYRLAEYFEFRYERKNLFNVINAGEDRGIIMLGSDDEAPIPRNQGWQKVTVDGRVLYAKFAKIAINVLKEEPNDGSATPNILTNVLENWFGKQGYLPQHGNRVRISPAPQGEGVWLIEPYRGRTFS